MFIAIWFIIIKEGKQPKGPFLNRGMDKQNVVYECNGILLLLWNIIPLLKRMKY